MYVLSYIINEIQHVTLHFYLIFSREICSSNWWIRFSCTLSFMDLTFVNNNNEYKILFNDNIQWPNFFLNFPGHQTFFRCSNSIFNAWWRRASYSISLTKVRIDWLPTLLKVNFDGCVLGNPMVFIGYCDTYSSKYQRNIRLRCVIWE